MAPFARGKASMVVAEMRGTKCATRHGTDLLVDAATVARLRHAHTTSQVKGLADQMLFLFEAG